MKQDGKGLTHEISLLTRQISELESRLSSAKKVLSEPEKQRDAAGNSENGDLLSPEEKVRLFRSLFRGRDDVYPKLWENPRQNKKGYAPACRNEWVRGVCEKPRVKCGECPNQSFLAVTDQAILDHLQGRHVIGVYPLLANETTWFLAVDFDENSWEVDVRAFITTCRHHSVPYLIERSRSGNGAHVWFFFSAPDRASHARALGTFLLTQTMSERHQLSMSSYDRLFPSQDTMPKGGFGNLIALPLQWAARQRGNSIFLDDALEPFAEARQWKHLASIRRITQAEVDNWLAIAADSGNLLGVRIVDDPDEEPPPWERNRHVQTNTRHTIEGLPERLAVVRGQRLYIRHSSKCKNQEVPGNIGLPGARSAPGRKRGDQLSTGRLLLRWLPLRCDYRTFQRTE